jgi:hypothetical protein
LLHDEAPEAPAPAPAAAPVAPAAPVAEPTLHDFVLNLLRDPSAQQAFDLDPTGCLHAAGLHDLLPADVHDVIPLVMDLVPTDGLGGVEGLTSGLSLAGEAGAHGGWAALESDTPLGDIEGAGKVAAGLDGLTAGLTGAAETPIGMFGVGTVAEASTQGAVHTGAAVWTPFGSVENNISAGLGEDGAFLGVDLHSGDQHLVVGLDSDLDLDQNLVPGLPNGGLGDLAKGLADPTAVASAIAGAVPALPGVVQGLPVVSDLPVDLPALPAIPVDVPQLPALPALPTEHVGEVLDTAQGALGSVGDLPHVGQLPDVLGHLPGGLPQLPHLPIDLPHLPVDLPHLPVDLPHLPVDLPIGDGSGHGPVGDIVDHSGLGNVINNNPVTDVVHDVVPDLHLGL